MIGDLPAAAAQRADTLVGLGRPADAAAVLSDALAAGPERADLLRRLAAALLAAGRPAEALDAADRLVRLDPEAEEGHRLAADALGRLGRPTLAVEAADVAVRLAPGEWRARAALARALVGASRPRDGWAAAARAVELAPAEAAAHAAVGAVAAALGDSRQATAAYRHALVLDPADPAARDGLAALDSESPPLAGLLAGPPPAAEPAPALHRDPEATWRTGMTLVVRVQWLVAVASYAGLAANRTAPYTVGALTGAIVLLGAFGWLRWQSQPTSVRVTAARLPRTDRRARLVVLFAAGGALALLGVVPAAMLGELPAARTAVVVAVAATTAAAVAAGRRRAATPGPAAVPAGPG